MFPTNRYLFLEFLGQGGVTSSYKAVDRKTGENVVIKWPHPDIQANPRALAQIRARLKHWQLIQHPDLVPVLRGGISQGNLYWVQPFVSGGTFLAQDNFREDCQKIAGKLASSLNALHGAGFVHGNLKPSNVFFSEDGKLVLSDPWLFQPLQQHVSPQEWALPPEIRQSQRVPWKTESDVYGMATLIVYAAERAGDRSMRIWALSGGCKQHIKRALSADPMQRPSSVNALIENNRPRQASWSGKFISKRSVAPFAFVALLLLGLFFSRSVFLAQAASPLRQVLGNTGVAQLQTVYFQIQDWMNHLKVRGNQTQPPLPPWRENPVGVAEIAPTPPVSVSTPPVLQESLQEHSAGSSDVSSGIEPVILPAPDPTATLPTQTAQRYFLPDLQPLGVLENEGVWQAYISADNLDQPLALRTLLQPDPARPFSIVAVVAFDLQRTQLRYMPGSAEPGIPGGPRGAGTIPVSERGRTIATFNSGFLTTHGQFGAWLNGETLVPLRPELATVGIQADEKVLIGAWGSDFDFGIPWQALRQNARLIVHHGAVGSHIYSDSLQDWGGTINGDIVTWRSAIGVNQSGTILYYVAGSGLSMPALAPLLVRAGAYNAMLLDINAYWVHFASVQTMSDNSLSAQPLFPEMDTHIDRYLRPGDRDFFYVLTNPALPVDP